MLVLNQEIQVAWCPANRKHFESLGYIFTKWRDKFLVKAEDLSNTSTKKVKVICDYCTKTYFTSYKLYYKGISLNGKNACKSCAIIKNNELFKKKYGVENPFALEEIKEKIKKTNLKNLGVENPGQSSSIKEKIKKTNLERRGMESSLSDPEVRKKCEQTLLQRFGVKNPFESQQIQNEIKENLIKNFGVTNVSYLPEILEKRKQTSLRKRGVECPFQDPEVIAKCKKTLYANGTSPKSKAEIEMCNRLIEIYGKEHCFPSYPFDILIFDCLLEINEVKIDIEYDGWFWHKDKIEEDKRRNYAVIRRGIKVLRFVANNEIPSKELLKQEVEELLNTSKKIKIIKLDI